MKGLKGKHAVYCVAEGEDNGALCDFVGLGFSNNQNEIEYPSVPAVEIKVDGVALDLPIEPERADNNNGYTGYGKYRIEYELVDENKIPVVTALSDSDLVKKHIKQAKTASDEAVVTFDFMGIKKEYIIRFVQDKK